MSARLEAGFEDALATALLDDAEHELVGQEDPLVFQAIQKSHGVLLTYGLQHGYDVEPIIDALGQVDVERGDRHLSITWGWNHEAAPYFHFGTSDHTVDGDPVLSFVWEDPPQWVQEEFEAEGAGWRVFFGSVDVSGIPESRFVTAAIEWLRETLQT